MKEDTSLGNSDAVLPIASSSGSLTQTILSSQTDAINDDIKPVVQTIMDKRTMTQGTYEKFSVNNMARVTKLAAEYGVFSTIRHFTIYTVRNFTKVCNWPNCPLKKGTFLVDKLKVVLFNCSGPYILVNSLSSHNGLHFKRLHHTGKHRI